MKPKSEFRAAREMVFIHVGQFRIGECGDGKVWIQKDDGEGMETAEAKFEQVVEKFFEKEF